MKDNISLVGDRKKWIEFTYEVKKQKKEVWEVIEPFLEQYIKKHKNVVKK